MTTFETRNGITPETYYADKVAKKVRARYTQDDVEALMANYMSNPTQYKAEWDAFQSYRAECKEEARRELGI